MTGFNSERSSIEGLFASSFSTLPIRWENWPFVPPPTGGYVAFFIRDGFGQNISTGPTPRRRYAGLVDVQIFVEENSGTATARGYADTIAAIFLNVQLTPAAGTVIRFRVPSISQVQPSAGWLQFNVSCPFQRDVN